MTPHVTKPAFAASSGPRDAKIALVGEAWGEHEAREGRPFVGASGQELTRLLTEAGIDREACFLTNVIAGRPAPTSNNFDQLCGSKLEVGKGYPLPPIKPGKYLRPQYLAELLRLTHELKVVKPNIVVALGGTATWALIGTGAISRVRGTVTPGKLTSVKVLPTFHPAYLFQVWKDRPIVLLDLMKARRESAYPEFRRPERKVHVSPTLGTVAGWIDFAMHPSTIAVAVDIETTNGQIESIGFATSKDNALVVPFVTRSPLRSYWPTHEEEVQARRLCNRLLSSRVPKIGQNFLFDLQFLLREGFTPRACMHDTMLLHHAMYPELQKGLAFLGSCYTNEPAWKLMRKRKKEEQLKRDD